MKMKSTQKCAAITKQHEAINWKCQPETAADYACIVTTIIYIAILYSRAPMELWILMPGVLKLSCSTIFIPFLHLVFVYLPFHLYFIPKTLRDTSVFSSQAHTYFEHILCNDKMFHPDITVMVVSPDITLCGWLGSKNQLTN